MNQFTVYSARPLRETLIGAVSMHEIAIIGQTAQGESAVVGRYTRNHRLLNTFAHFQRGGRHFALYSPDVRRTRLMEILPESGFRDLGAEPVSDDGFCAAEYMVPTVERPLGPDEVPGDPDMSIVELPRADGERWLRYPSNHAFVAGWLARDPDTWLIQHLDLTLAEEGQLLRSARFGRAELLPGASLADLLDASEAAATWNHPEGPVFRLALPVGFHIGSGRRVAS